MIRKAIITVTVLYDDAISGPPGHLELSTLAEALDDDMIGQVEDTSDEPVPADRVEQELLAIGNDGTFFGDSDDEA